MNLKPVNYIFVTLVLLICGCLSVLSQNRCNLQIGIYEFKEDGSSEQFPVQDAKINLVETKTKKSLKISKNTAVPTVEGVSEGEYSITVSKNGFQKTVIGATVDCSLVNSENTFSAIVFLWKGDSNKTFDGYSKNRGTTGFVYNTGAEKPVNDGAVLLAKPEYPKAAKAVRASGKVEVQVTINELGYVISAQAISGHPLLRSAAVESAKKSKFRMTTLDKIPVKVTGIIVYNFVP